MSEALALAAFGFPVLKFFPAEASGGVRLEGMLVTCDPETGRASAIEPVRAPWPAT